MRIWTRLGVLAIAVACTTALSGCREHWEYHFGPIAVAQPEKPPARTVRKAAKPKKTKAVANRVLEPRVVPAGAKVRSFCGQRHVRFQSGKLTETTTEKARNDVLCSQVY